MIENCCHFLQVFVKLDITALEKHQDQTQLMVLQEIFVLLVHIVQQILLSHFHALQGHLVTTQEMVMSLIVTSVHQDIIAEILAK